MKIEKVEKIIANFHDKKEYVIHTSLKQALYLGFEKYKKKWFLDKLNQEVWLKPYIYVNTGLRENAKNDFEKDFLKLMNIKIITAKARSNYLVLKPKYTTNFFSDNSLTMGMKRTKIWLNQSI